jgi:hypothetical protein
VRQGRWAGASGGLFGLGDMADEALATVPDQRGQTYAGFPHGMLTTHAETINNDLLTFIQS